MKIKNYLAWMIMSALSVSTVACSDDDDNENGGNAGIGNVSTVFPYGTLSGINRDGQKYISDMVYDNNGRLTSMNFNGTLYTIAYTSSNTVRVTCNDEGEIWARDFTLGSNGYINGGTYTDTYGTTTWTVGYDAQGHAISQTINTRETSGYTSVSNLSITYNSNGDLTSYTYTDNETESNGTKHTYTDNATVNYTNSTITTPIENKGYVMLFDQIFNIDLDEDLGLYYAGLLGKGTAHLPLTVTIDSRSDNYTDTDVTNITWALNSNNYPASVTIDEGYGYNETFSFIW